MSDLGAKLLRSIVDSEELSQIEETLSRAIYSELKSKLSRNLILVKVERWIAVPTLNFPDVTLILEHQEQTRLKASNGEMYGVVLPIFGQPGFAYEVPLTLEGIQEFVPLLAYSPFSPVLFTGKPQPDWIVASMESEFHIVAGTSEAVEHLIGCTAEESFSHFRAFINRFSASESAPALSRMFNTYYNFIYDQLCKYQYASTGSKFLLTLS